MSESDWSGEMNIKLDLHSTDCGEKSMGREQKQQEEAAWVF